MNYIKIGTAEIISTDTNPGAGWAELIVSLQFIDDVLAMTPSTSSPYLIAWDANEQLSYYKNKALERVKQASAAHRLNFVTHAAGKDAEYTFKAQEAAQYNLDNSVGEFMQARINATGEAAASIAAEWNAKAAGWKAIGGAIAGLEDKANIDINTETIAANCEAIADSIIANIEVI